MEIIQTEYKAEVTNNSNKPYEEMFKGQVVKFAPMETQMWDWNEAVQFKGQFIPVMKNDVGAALNEKRISVKKIFDPNAPRKVAGYQNPFTGRVFATEAELKADLANTSQNTARVTEREDKRLDDLQTRVETQGHAISEIVKAVNGLTEAVQAKMLAEVPEKVSRRGRAKKGVGDDTTRTNGSGEGHH